MYSSGGASAYSRVGMQTSVVDASPHRLIVLLYEGARKALAVARMAAQSGDIATTPFIPMRPRSVCAQALNELPLTEGAAPAARAPSPARPSRVRKPWNWRARGRNR